MPLTYLFSANTGRSGSKYLAGLFEGHPQVAAHHEGKPVLCGVSMRQWLAGDPVPMRKAMDEKKSNIQQALYGRKLYLETNHCFIKGFGWELMAHLPPEQIAVVVLDRPALEVAKSFYRIGVNPLGKRGHHWLITPQPESNETAVWRMPPSEWQRFQRAQRFARIYDGINRKLGRLLPDPLEGYKMTLLQTYVAHIRTLTDRFFDQFPQVTRIDATLTDLNNPGFIATLCEKLGVAFTKDMERRVGIKRNERAGRR
jgi:hypothetical protein